MSPVVASGISAATAAQKASIALSAMFEVVRISSMVVSPKGW
jgi:hypothetical protein